MDRAARYAQPGTVMRVYADLSLGAVDIGTVNNRKGWTLVRRGLQEARALNDPRAICLATMTWLVDGMAPWCGEEALRAANEAWAASRQPGLDIRSIDYGCLAARIGYLACGRREQAEQVFRAVKDLAAHTHQIHHKISSEAVEANRHMMDGHLENALAMYRRIQDTARDSGVEGHARVQLDAIGLRPHIHLGKAEEYLRRYLEERYFSNLTHLALAYLGRRSEAAELLDKMLDQRPDITSFEDETSVMTDIPYLESAVMIGHARTADLMLRRFATNTLATTGNIHTTVIARHLGAAAVMLGRTDEARQHYREAIRVCTEMRFRPELALTRLQLAELLLDHYPAEKKDALEHLDFAIKEFREMKMQPSLERALRRKEILKA